MLDSERQRMIDGLSGAELEVWEGLGHPMTEKMQARLAAWRDGEHAKRVRGDAERRNRERLFLEEQAALAGLRMERRRRHDGTDQSDAPRGRAGTSGDDDGGDDGNE